VLIAENIPDHRGDERTEQFMLATGIPGMVGLIETLNEVVEEMKKQRADK
jgi:hypothetical protein